MNMLGYSLVNALGACLIITSMTVVLAKTVRASACLYSLQSLVLVAILASHLVCHGIRYKGRACARHLAVHAEKDR